MVSERGFPRRTAPPAAPRRRARQLCVVRAGSITDRVEQAFARNAGLETRRRRSLSHPPRLEGGHSIHISELAALFEVFAAQLHRFPESPADYRVQEDEPTLEGSDHVLLVASISGAGKTAWASHSAVHSGEAIVYFDAAGVPDAAVPSALLREAIAQLTTQAGMDSKDAVQPGASGLEGLRGVDFLAKRANIRPVIVIDNVHTVTAGTLQKTADALASCRLVLLAQPAPVIAQMEALLGTEAVVLKGWSLVTIVSELDSAHAPVDLATAERVRQLTGGVPRFVSNTAALASNHYSGDAQAFCRAVESAANTTRTAQELILRESFDRLSADARLAVALLSLARFPLAEFECLEFLSSHARFRSGPAAAAAIRELQDWGVVQRLMSGALVTHDAFVVMATALFEALEPDIKMAAKQTLAAVVEKSIAPGQVARLMVYCRLLPQIGRTEVLADIASSLSEHIHEQGRSGDLEAVLEDVLVSAEVTPLDKFMVADTLALWEFHRPDKTGFVKLVRTMERLAREHDLGGDTPSRLAMKQMLEASLNHELAGIRLYSARSLQHGGHPGIAKDSALCNTATAYYMADEPQETLEITGSLIEEYYGVPYLNEEQVFARSAKVLADEIGSDFDVLDELKRLADTLDLRARALNEVGLPSGLCRLHAMKFYQIAHVPMSLMKVGQDVVDEFLGMLRDPWEARRVIETMLLPIVDEYRLVEYVVPVRSQYAVILAYCGEVEAARRLIGELEAFAVSDFRRLELQNQSELLERIAAERRFVPETRDRSESAESRTQRARVRAGPGRSTRSATERDRELQIFGWLCAIQRNGGAGEDMVRLGRGGFTNSARAELFAYRRRKKKRIEVYLELDAQSKKRQNSESLDRQFISGVEKALKGQGRDTPFRLPVAIQMHFQGRCRADAAPDTSAPQALPRPAADAARIPSGRPPSSSCCRTIVSLKRYFGSHSFADEEPAAPFMTFDVMTLTTFIRDLELHQKIATGDFDDVDGVRELEINNPYGMGDYEEEFRDNSIEEYRRLIKMGESGKKQYGEKLYDAPAADNTHAAQRELLRRRELRPIDIGTLYGPAPSRKRNDELFRSLREISAANVRLVTELGVACADLGPPATQPGDSEMLKQQGACGALAENAQPVSNPRSPLSRRSGSRSSISPRGRRSASISTTLRAGLSCRSYTRN